MDSPSKEELKAKYNADIRISANAEKALPYFNSLLDRFQNDLFEAFLAAPFRDEEELLKIKFASEGAKAVLNRIIVDIDNGKIAAKQLIELEK